MSDSYVMPVAEVGDWVLFRVHAGADAVPAMVTRVSSRTLTLWAVAPGYGGTEKASVHHTTDPGVEQFPAWAEYGFWEYKPQKNAILAEKVALLEKKVAEIEARKPR
jgi:hypothetical protein